MMKMTFPWYGDKDPITIDHLNYLRGINGISLADNDFPAGEALPAECLLAQREKAESAGYVCDILEDLPVHRDIKLRCGEYGRYIDNYKENIASLAEAGIRVIGYGFAPEEGDGFQALGSEGLWANLASFVREIVPVAIRNGVSLAFRLGGPCAPGSGMQSLIAGEGDIDRFLSLHGAPCHGIAMSSVNLESSGFEAYLGMINKYVATGRIHYALLRDVKAKEDCSFEETAHCSPYDSRDMVKILTAYHETGYNGYARFDHSRMGLSGEPNFDMYDRTVGTMYVTGILLTLDSRVKAAPKEKIA
ncbi:MAG: mannonate dehydratase [Synergistaceae bacterium]|jgi:mannonate dehydratase|nr:mannonate dehydratase [Synergistaceae bacterium]